jgi:hypothetical protein
MRVNKKFVFIAILILITAMVMATQYAVTRLGYEFGIVHPSNSDLRYIGSDNSSDGVRLLRVDGMNGTNATVKLSFGNSSTYQNYTYTASFGIVNEELFPVNITHIEVISSNWTYMSIWLHGNRSANAIDNISDPSSVYMFNNGTILNASNTTAWTLAAGNKNTSDMCSNVSDRVNNSCNTTWDETAHVRYSLNNTNATSGLSDYVWIQISIDITNNVVDYDGTHTGLIYIHFTADTTT